MNLFVEKGEFLVIMGVSGSGKIIFFNCILMIDKLILGEIWFEDFDIIYVKENELVDYCVKNIFYIF